MFDFDFGQRPGTGRYMPYINLVYFKLLFTLSLFVTSCPGFNTIALISSDFVSVLSRPKGQPKVSTDRKVVRPKGQPKVSTDRKVVRPKGQPKVSTERLCIKSK